MSSPPSKRSRNDLLVDLDDILGKSNTDNQDILEELIGQESSGTHVEVTQALDDDIVDEYNLEENNNDTHIEDSQVQENSIQNEVSFIRNLRYAKWPASSYN